MRVVNKAIFLLVLSWVMSMNVFAAKQDIHPVTKSLCVAPETVLFSCQQKKKMEQVSV